VAVRQYSQALGGSNETLIRYLSQLEAQQVKEAQLINQLTGDEVHDTPLLNGLLQMWNNTLLN
jgi:hypothetical protein